MDTSSRISARATVGLTGGSGVGGVAVCPVEILNSVRARTLAATWQVETCHVLAQALTCTPLSDSHTRPLISYSRYGRRSTRFPASQVLIRPRTYPSRRSANRGTLSACYYVPRIPIQSFQGMFLTTNNGRRATTLPNPSAAYSTHCISALRGARDPA